MKFIVPSVLFLFLFVSGSFASHIVGGDIGVERLQGNNARIYLNLYFDVLYGNEGADDPEVIVSIFRKNGNEHIRDLSLPKVNTTPVVYTNPPCAIAELQTELIVYQTNYLLDPAVFSDPQGYYVSWQRCCRNGVITNIQDPGQSGMVFYAEFPPVIYEGMALKNSSPVFNALKGDFLCLGQTYTYPFGATDPDGDQLVYSLVTPLRGTSTTQEIRPPGVPAPYSLVSWNPGFLASEAVPGASPGFTLNPVTGQLTVRPTMIGLFVFTVKSEEYRNNRKIGEVRRDFQWKVINCPQNQAPAVSVQHPNGQTYQPGDTIVVTSQADACFKVLGLDSVNTKLTFKINPVNYSQPVVAPAPGTGTIIEAGVPVGNTICWPDCESARTLPYSFEVEVTDQGCPVPLKSKMLVHLAVRPTPNPKPQVTTSLFSNTVYLLTGDSVQFNVTATDTATDIVFLSYQGVGFDPATLGMQFTEGSAPETYTSPFYWKPACNALALPQPLEITFTARDNSCFSQNYDTVSVFIYLTDIDNKEKDFLPANVFTPNNDGVNDAFSFPSLPLNNCASRFEKVAVFNRWGKKVFETTNRSQEWKAATEPEGVYFYLVTFSNRTYKGTVTVLK